MRICLLSPPYLPEYMRNARCDFVSLSATQWYPILLGTCGALLEGRGHTVKMIDAPAHGLMHAETERLVHEFHPDLLVLYSGRKSEDNDLSIGDKLLETCGCDGVIVGPYASITPSATLSRARHLDKLAFGEFDLTVAEIALGKPAQEILGLAHKVDGTVVENPPRPYMTSEQLDHIPFVSRFFKTQIDVRRYHTPSEGYPYMDMMTGRGCCWGMCTYCLWVHTFVKGRTYNVRSIPGVIEEFQFIQREMPQIQSVMLQDDTFTETRAIEFCESYLRLGLKIPWSCYARANMNFDVLALMKQANCRNLHVGYESADQAILNRIRKGISVERMTRFTRDAKRARLRIHGDFAFGFPGETPEAARKTIRWACHMNPDTAQFQLMIPFPGTPYFEEMQRNGWLNTNGEPDMPQFPNAVIRQMGKEAYRAFYLSPRHVLKCLRHPFENVFSQWKTISRAIPALFWKRWQV
ncbi:MAG: radical SAM protein [Candidatus Ozemobacteraceae bacterium]